MRIPFTAAGCFAGSCFALLLAGCSFIAVQTAPAKVAAPSRSAAALQADALFWSTLHGGRYDDIGKALEAQTGAYLQNPNDAVTAAHTGFLHIWRLSESARVASLPATITDDAVLARKYFQEAVALKPEDARFVGFLASAELAEGSIHHDQKLSRQGWFRMQDAIDAWPEFNLFTAGFTVSGQPHDAQRYADAVEWQWKTLDLCTGQRIDRSNPSLAGAMNRETTTGPQRVCWNSWIAPHNFEGFFLNMGDMLVKAGDWQTAQKIYANARLSKTYADWPFKQLLEDRIAAAAAGPALAEGFRRGRAVTPRTDDATMMVASRFSCVACHQGASTGGAPPALAALPVAAR